MGKALVGDGGARYMKNPCTSSQVCFELKTAFFFFFFFALFSLLINLFCCTGLSCRTQEVYYGI